MSRSANLRHFNRGAREEVAVRVSVVHVAMTASVGVNAFVSVRCKCRRKDTFDFVKEYINKRGVAAMARARCGGELAVVARVLFIEHAGQSVLNHM